MLKYGSESSVGIPRANKHEKVMYQASDILVMAIMLGFYEKRPSRTAWLSRQVFLFFIFYILFSVF